VGSHEVKFAQGCLGLGSMHTCLSCTPLGESLAIPFLDRPSRSLNSMLAASKTPEL
jgi:hypothetical protein